MPFPIVAPLMPVGTHADQARGGGVLRLEDGRVTAYCGARLVGHVDSTEVADHLQSGGEARFRLEETLNGYVAVCALL